MITAAAENKEITCNSSFFKKIGKPVLCDDEIDDILESGKSKETRIIISQAYIKPF
jgi:hypothetical protein